MRLINKYQRIIGISSSSSASYYPGGLLKSKPEKPKVKFSPNAYDDYETEDLYKAPGFDDYAKKLQSKEYQFENAYSHPPEFDNYKEEEPQYFRGNISGKLDA
jgi:hypothetical protein